MHLTPLFLALIALVSADDSVLLEFDPPLLSMKTSTSTFKVRMTKPPSVNAKANVYLVQPGFQFSKCRLEFDHMNFNTSQEIEIVTAPSFSKENKKAIVEVEICAPDTAYTNLKEEYTVEPKQFPGKTCKTIGGIQPHSFNSQIPISFPLPARNLTSRDRAHSTYSIASSSTCKFCKDTSGTKSGERGR
jgi:hypothetical protein